MCPCFPNVTVAFSPGSCLRRRGRLYACAVQLTVWVLSLSRSTLAICSRGSGAAHFCTRKTACSVSPYGNRRGRGRGRGRKGGRENNTEGGEHGLGRSTLEGNGVDALEERVLVCGAVLVQDFHHLPDSKGTLEFLAVEKLHFSLFKRLAPPGLDKLLRTSAVAATTVARNDQIRHAAGLEECCVLYLV